MRKIKEFTESPIIRRALDRSVSPKEGWNLKMDVEALKKQLNKLQDTANKLPDDYVEDLCDSKTYPLDDVIDSDYSLNAWCDEVDDFLDTSFDF